MPFWNPRKGIRLAAGTRSAVENTFVCEYVKYTDLKTVLYSQYNITTDLDVPI